MSSLSEILLALPDREGLVNDLARALEAHIASRGGMKGIAMKAGFATLKVAKPDIAARAMRNLLPDMAKALDPLHSEFRNSSDSDFGVFLSKQIERASNEVLGVTDARISTSDNTAGKALYQRFRSGAGEELEKLLPTIGRILTTHAS